MGKARARNSRARRAAILTPVTAETSAPGHPGASTTIHPAQSGTSRPGYEGHAVFPNREIVERYYVPLIYTACRTCYSELAPDDIFERAVDGRIAPEKQRELIGRVIESGHGSTIEHVVFTFAITGASRTLSHQLVRHRAGVAFDQQSQRYVTYKKGASTMLPGTIAEADPELLEPATRTRSRARSSSTPNWWKPAYPAKMRASYSRMRPAPTWS